MRTGLPLAAINVVIGLALLLIGVMVSLVNRLLKRIQAHQFARLWSERTLWPDDGGPSSSEEGRRGRRISGGSDSPLDTDLLTRRRHVRLWLAQGLLPSPMGATWAGPGSGQLCAVCARVIAETETEYEVGNGAGRLYAHQPCYAIWYEEAGCEDAANSG
jgi:hypothetical protein